MPYLNNTRMGNICVHDSCNMGNHGSWQDSGLVMLDPGPLVIPVHPHHMTSSARIRPAGLVTRRFEVPVLDTELATSRRAKTLPCHIGQWGHFWVICFMSTLGKTFDEIVWHQHPWNVSRSSPGPAVFPSPQAGSCLFHGVCFRVRQ